MDIVKYREHFNKMKTDEEYRKFFQKKKLEDTIQKWKAMHQMIDRDDVPDLPNVDIEEWVKTFVPILIDKGAIPKNQLIDGEWYYGNYRNSELGKWDATKNKFLHLRYKFGYMWDDCNHFEDDDRFALFVPLRKATQEEIQTQEKIIQDLN